MKALGIIIVAVLLAAFAATLQGATTKTTLRVEGMTCTGCETAVRMVLKKVPGVTSADVSYEKKQAVVTYDPSRTTPAKLAAAIAEAFGYKVTVASGTVAPIASAAAAPSCEVPVKVPTSGKTIALAPYGTNKLREEFNRTSDRLRVVALLSPTCGICQTGQRVVESVFSKYPKDTRLRGFVVWLPILPTDSEKYAGAQAAAFVDSRVTQQWDGERVSGALLAKTLGLKGTAWDIYLLYAPGVRWTGEQPPAPTFWMHQLRAESRADQSTCLNPSVFVGKVASLIGLSKGGS